MRVEVDAKAVDEVFDSVTKEIQKQAALPGFRPGKAPRAMVEKKYGEDIKVEAKRKLIGDNYRKALEEKEAERDWLIRTSKRSLLAAARICSLPPRLRPRRNLRCPNTRASPRSAKIKP